MVRCLKTRSAMKMFGDDITQNNRVSKVLCARCGVSCSSLPLRALSLRAVCQCFARNIVLVSLWRARCLARLFQKGFCGLKAFHLYCVNVVKVSEKNRGFLL